MQCVYKSAEFKEKSLCFGSGVVMSALNAHKVKRSRSKKEPNACILPKMAFSLFGSFLIQLFLNL